jgi:hypothetical protein
MICYMNIEEQVDVDFIHARRRASLRRIGARLLGHSSSSAPSFEEARKVLGARNKLQLGRRVVAVEEIVGSVGRPEEFDGAFLPLRRSLEGRWKRVDRAFHLGVDLPSVVLYKLGESYFVSDGNHRISVARYQNVQWIEAEVTLFYVRTRAVPTGVGQGWKKVPLPDAA